jgi:glycosyltransferase involved in cell wall biosynthesis
MPHPTLLLDTYIFTKPPGGMAKATAFLYEALLQRNDLPFNIQGISAKAIYPESLPAGLRNTVLPIPLAREAWRATILPVYAQLQAPQWIHFPANGLIPAGLPRSTRVITTLHDVLQLDVEDFYPPELTHKRTAYYQRLKQDVQRSDVILTVSEYSRQRIEHHFADVLKHPPLVIPNAPTLDPSLGYARFNTSQAPYFLYTGRYEKRKGLEWLLEAFLEGKLSHQLSSKLLLTGAPAPISPRFESLLKRGVEAGWVEELGYVSDEAMVRLMQGAQALVYPSQAEGFGLPPLEAMQFGCPVITTRQTALPFTCGDAAYYVEAEDPHSLTIALQRLENEPNLRETLIQLGHEQLIGFSWHRSASLFLETLLAVG